MKRTPRTPDNQMEASSEIATQGEPQTVKKYTAELVTEYKEELKKKGYFLSDKNAHYLFSKFRKEKKVDKPNLLADVTVKELYKKGITSTNATSEIRKLRKGVVIIVK